MNILGELLDDGHFWTVAVLAGTLALLVSFGLTPLMRMYAKYVGAVDIPKDNRRMHTRPLPRMGGIAIFLGFIFSVLVFVEISHELKGILLGAVVIVIMGAIDDILTLKPLPRLLIQFVAAAIPVIFGVRIENITNFAVTWRGIDISLGWLSIPGTLIWIVALTNAVNWIDGLDGLAAGVASISSLTLFFICAFISDPVTAIIMIALAGACLGFLPFNFNPSRIIMGDCGSMFLGYILATMSIFGLFKFYALISFIIPFLMLALPIFDITAAILRRLAAGQNPMKADRKHVHHRLIDMGFSQKTAVAMLYAISGVFGIAGILLALTGNIMFLLVLLAFAVFIAIGAQVFAAIMISAKPSEPKVPTETLPEKGKTDE